MNSLILFYILGALFLVGLVVLSVKTVKAMDKRQKEINDLIDKNKK